MKAGAIKITAADGSVIFCGLITELPLREDYIITKSIERFNESEPCIIYRTSIAKRFYLQLFEKLKYFKENNITSILCSDVYEFFNSIDFDTSGAMVQIE
jgi:hypothetical protein